MTKAGFTLVWAFEVRAEAQEDFEVAYGPQGDWVRLFRKGEGYLGSRLYQDVQNSLSYTVADYWRSKADYENFKARRAEEYQALDTACEPFTIEETFLGSSDLQG